MKYKNMAEIVSHSAGGEIQRAYSVCRKIIGARFHSAVLSLKMNIDFYPIIYRQKMRNLLSDVSYPIEKLFSGEHKADRKFIQKGA